MPIETEAKKPFFELRSHRFYNLAILVAGLLAFVFVPLFMLTPGQSQQYLNNGREVQVLGNVAFVTACFTVLFGLIYWVFTLIRLKDMGATLIMFVLAWIALAGFLFPLTTADGMFDLRFEATYVRNMIIVAVLSTIFAVLSVSRYSKTAQVFMTIFLAVSILPSLPRAFSQFEKQDGTANAVKLSPEKNLIMVGLDGVPGHVVKDLLKENAEFAQTFKDFTFYDNVSSTSPATHASLLGIIHGNHDFTKYDTPDWPDAKDLYFNQAEKINFTTGYTYNLYNKTGTKLAAGQYGPAEQRNELFELYHNVILRLAGNYGATMMYWIDAWNFPDRKGKIYKTVEGFDRMLETLVVDSDKPSVFYTHYTFTHWPAVTDENCGNQEVYGDWFETHQNKAGVRAGAICGLKKYTELIAKLKGLGIYDRSDIILMSDHGKPVIFYDSQPHNLEINKSRTLGFDRYQPFLMIKPAQRSRDAMAISKKHVLLDDLAQTTCNLFEAPEFCEQTPGVNILDDADVGPDDFYIHVVENEESSWGLSHHKAVKISRHMPLRDAMMASSEIELTERE